MRVKLFKTKPTVKDVQLGKLSDWIPGDVLQEFLSGEVEVTFYMDGDKLEVAVRE